MVYRFYVGSYGEPQDVSISRYRADFEAGALVRELAFIGADWPSYVLAHPNGKILYAVRELTKIGAIHAYAVEDDRLVLLGTWETGGNDPCNLCLDDTGRWLFVANYSGSTVAVFRLDENGVPTERTECRRHEGSGPNTARQSAAHPHCVVLRDGILYVCDLGADTLFRYRFDSGSGTLTPDWNIPFAPGVGPRHMAFHPRHPELLYVICELASEVRVLRLEADRAVELQRIRALPEDFTGQNIAAAIKFSDDGKTLFTSNRGHDSIAVFSVHEDGTLTAEQFCPCGGRTPRDFTVFGDHLLVANQDSDLIAAFRYDGEARRLEKIPSIGLLAVKPTHILKLED